MDNTATTTFNKDLPIAIGADHAGFSLKKDIISLLEGEGWKVIDKGTYSEESTDYPDYAHPVAELVESGDVAAGILICGSGNGICMTANKHHGVRAALCWEEEIAALSRQHNNANVLCMPARFIPVEKAKAITDVFMSTAFEGGRHQKRVDKI